MTPLKLVGLISAFTGAAFLSLGGRKLNINDKTVLGDFLIVINAAIYGYYLVMVRPLMLRYSVFTIIMWVFIFGGMVNILPGDAPPFVFGLGKYSSKRISRSGLCCSLCDHWYVYAQCNCLDENIFLRRQYLHLSSTGFSGADFNDLV